MKNTHKQKQFQFDKPGFRKERSDHGGSIKNPQKRKRPLGIRSSMHVVLKSEKAKGKWSLCRKKKEVNRIISKFSQRYYIEVLSFAIVGNHIHLHLRVRQRKLYRAFIRAITAAIAMKVTGFNRWNKAPKNFKFWDYRPFSRIISTWKEYLNLSNYVKVNQWEGLGVNRVNAYDLVARGVLAESNTS